MSSIVLELQKDTLDKNMSLSDLLRKSLVVARKLKIKEFEVWITNELSGYTNKSVIPGYRSIKGELKAFNPYRGYIPVAFHTSEDAEPFCNRKTGQSVAELENLTSESKGHLQMPCSPEAQQVLERLSGCDFPVTLFIPAAQISRIIDMIRTIVLNWTLKLEEDGILGEGFSFSKDELNRASKTPQSITNYFGPITNSQIQQNCDDSVQVMKTQQFDYKKLRSVLEQLEKSLNSLNLEIDSKKELQSDLACIKEQLKSPKPKDSIIKYALSSILRALEGCEGAVAAALFLKLNGLG